VVGVALGTCATTLAILVAVETGEATPYLVVGVAGPLVIVIGLRMLALSDSRLNRAREAEFFGSHIAHRTEPHPRASRRPRSPIQPMLRRLLRRDPSKTKARSRPLIRRRSVDRAQAALHRRVSARVLFVGHVMRRTFVSFRQWTRRQTQLSVSALRAVGRMGHLRMPRLRGAVRFGVVRRRRAGWMSATAVALILGAVVAGSVWAYVMIPNDDPFVGSSSPAPPRASAATPPPLGVVVPITRGLTVRAAMTTLSARGLSVLKIEPVLGQPGVVMDSRPAAGDRASPGQAVVLFVGVPPERLGR
jgi:hypothetical protein